MTDLLYTILASHEWSLIELYLLAIALLLVSFALVDLVWFGAARCRRWLRRRAVQRFFEGEHPHGRRGDAARAVSQRPVPVSGVAGWVGGAHRPESTAGGVGPARTGGPAPTSGQRASARVTAVPQARVIDPWLSKGTVGVE